MRVRGLKSLQHRAASGAVIVAPHAGAWIEIGEGGGRRRARESHPMRVRGLK